MESQFQQTDSKLLWQGQRSMTVYKTTPSRTVTADTSLAEELDTFYARFKANTINPQVVAYGGSPHQRSAYSRCLKAQREEALQESEHQKGSRTGWSLQTCFQSLHRPAGTSVHGNLQPLCHQIRYFHMLQIVNSGPCPVETSSQLSK